MGTKTWTFLPNDIPQLMMVDLKGDDQVLNVVVHPEGHRLDTLVKLRMCCQATELLDVERPFPSMIPPQKSMRSSQ